VQDNHSGSHAGVLRGLHYQLKNPQGKLVSVVAGEVFDVAVDLSNNLDGLSHLVVEGEEEDRPVHGARDLVMESAEEPREIASVRTERY